MRENKINKQTKKKLKTTVIVVTMNNLLLKFIKKKISFHFILNGLHKKKENIILNKIKKRRIFICSHESRKKNIIEMKIVYQEELVEYSLVAKGMDFI